MLIPIDKKPDWQNPPLITLLLIVVNIMCFTLLATDNSQKIEAFDYYLRSKLPDIEIPLYLEHLRVQQQDMLAERLANAYRHNPDMAKSYALQKMIVDGKFLQQLNANKLVKPTHPQYQIWLQQHQTFLDKLDHITSYRFALKNYDVDIISLFAHQFLHTDLAHLLWNVLFLFIFGFIVEATLGHLIFLAFYLIAGLASSLTSIAFQPDSALWGIGASGAIAGLVGSYAVLYGRRQIRFFYTLLFYFDYIKAPAYVLLPVWLGYELYSQLVSDDNINNLAHIGGLLSGALLAWSLKRYSNIQLLDQENEADISNNEVNEQYIQAMSLLENLRLNEAKNILEELLRQQTKVEYLYACYTIAKYQHQHEAMREFSQQILAQDHIDESYSRQIGRMFDELLQSPISDESVFSLSALRRLGLLFVQWEDIERLNQTVKLSISQAQEDPSYLHDSITMLANTLISKGMDTLAAEYRKQLPEDISLSTS